MSPQYSCQEGDCCIRGVLSTCWSRSHPAAAGILHAAADCCFQGLVNAQVSRFDKASRYMRPTDAEGIVADFGAQCDLQAGRCKGEPCFGLHVFGSEFHPLLVSGSPLFLCVPKENCGCNGMMFSSNRQQPTVEGSHDLTSTKNSREVIVRRFRNMMFLDSRKNADETSFRREAHRYPWRFQR